MSDRRTILGKFADGGYGLRVSKPGFDANENPVNHEHLIFNSDWGGTMPVYEIGHVNEVSAGASTGTFTYSGGDLGYIPMVLIYVECNGDLSYTGYAPSWLLKKDAKHVSYLRAASGNNMQISHYHDNYLFMQTYIRSDRITYFWAPPASGYQNYPTAIDFWFVVFRVEM